jgi:hypothetical protein
MGKKVKKAKEKKAKALKKATTQSEPPRDPGKPPSGGN